VSCRQTGLGAECGSEPVSERECSVGNADQIVAYRFAWPGFSPKPFERSPRTIVLLPLCEFLRRGQKAIPTRDRGRSLRRAAARSYPRPRLPGGLRLANARGRFPRCRTVALLEACAHRASRRFLKDGARSSLPQYRQTNLSALDAALDDRAVAARLCCFRGMSALRLAADHRFFRGRYGFAVLIDQRSRHRFGIRVQMRSPSRARAWYSAVVDTHCSVAAMLEAFLRILG